MTTASTAGSRSINRFCTGCTRTPGTASVTSRLPSGMDRTAHLRHPEGPPMSMYNAEILGYIARLTAALNALGEQPADVHLHIDLRDGDYLEPGEKPRVLGRWIDEHGGTAWFYEDTPKEAS